MYETNVIGSNICSREAVKLMKELSLEKGHIININRSVILQLRKRIFYQIAILKFLITENEQCFKSSYSYLQTTLK